jgi:hypothetical protein
MNNVQVDPFVLLKEEYVKLIRESSEKMTTQNLLVPELKVKLKQDDKEREFQAGTLFTIVAVGRTGVTLHRDAESVGTPDSYQASDFVVSYDDLEQEYELD